MKTNLPKEVDFLQEISNIERIRKIFKNRKHVIIPKPHRHLSTKKILVMDFERGYPVTDTQSIARDKLNTKAICTQLSLTFNEMIFKHGFIHSDPHPGNIFIRPNSHNSYGFDLVLLDNGLYNSLSSRVQLNYSKLWLGVFNADPLMAEQACRALGVGRDQRLFVAMITNQRYDVVMDKKQKNLHRRIKGESGFKEQKREKQNLALLHRQNILRCLEKMDRSLILIFKVNNYVSSIDYLLGSPISNYYHTYKFCFKHYISAENKLWWWQVLARYCNYFLNICLFHYFS